MNEEEIVDAEFEEIPERDVINITELPEEDIKKIEESEATDPSPEDAAAFAKELEEAQAELDAATKQDRPLTQREMIEAVNRAVADGVMSSRSKTRMMQEMGIYKSEFTKKRSVSKATKAKKRKAQKNARRKNRK